MSENAATISRYLLHELPPAEQEEIERRYFSDPDYLALVEAVESDLIDAYVRRELPQAQRERFEAYFLRTRGRRERVRMAEALAAQLPVKRRVSARRVLLAAAAVLVVAIAAAAWLRPSRNAVPVVVAQKPVVGHVTMTAILMPGLTRDVAAPRRIALASNTDQLQIRAVVDLEGDWRDLHASVKTSAGREVWSANGLHLDDDRTVPMLVPAAKLTAGEYVLVVSSNGEVLGDYPFFLTRP